MIIARLDSFSGPASDLKRGHRTPENVLAALRSYPRVSVWDMSEHCTWLPGCIDELKRRGLIEDDPKSRYPWCGYIVRAAASMAQPDGGES